MTQRSWTPSDDSAFSSFRIFPRFWRLPYRQRISPSSPVSTSSRELPDAGVVEQEVAGHHHEVALLSQCAELLGLLGPERRRLSTRTCFRRERAVREVEVGGNWRGDDDRVHRVVAENLVEVLGGARLREARTVPFQLLGRRVADPRQAREIVEVTREVGAPGGPARQRPRSRHSSRHKGIERLHDPFRRVPVTVERRGGHPACVLLARRPRFARGRRPPARSLQLDRVHPLGGRPHGHARDAVPGRHPSAARRSR